MNKIYIGDDNRVKIYKTNFDNKPMALKWFIPDYVNQDPDLREWMMWIGGYFINLLVVMPLNPLNLKNIENLEFFI